LKHPLPPARPRPLCVSTPRPNAPAWLGALVLAAAFSAALAPSTAVSAEPSPAKTAPAAIHATGAEEKTDRESPLDEPAPSAEPSVKPKTRAGTEAPAPDEAGQTDAESMPKEQPADPNQKAEGKEDEEEEPDFADRFSEAIGPVLRELVAQFSDYVFGPEGIPYMPLDFIGTKAEGGAAARKGKLPEAEADGVILSVIDKSTGHFSVELAGFENAAEYQLQDVWCWAAAVLSYERYKGLDPTGKGSQREIVERVFLDDETIPIEERSARSFQVVQALAYEENEELFPFEMTASIGWIADMEEADFSEEELAEHLRLFIDHYMGSQEIIESLLRGEPVLVSIAGDRMNHIQVLYGAEFSPIKANDSTELKVRGLSKLIEQSVGETTLIERGMNVLTMAQRFQKRYALRKVKLFDPWKAERDPAPELLQINEYSGFAFKRKVVYSLNREVAEVIIAAARERASQVDDAVDQELAQAGLAPAAAATASPASGEDGEPSGPAATLGKMGTALSNLVPGTNRNGADNEKPQSGGASPNNNDGQDRKSSKGVLGGFNTMFN